MRLGSGVSPVPPSTRALGLLTQRSYRGGNPSGAQEWVQVGWCWCWVAAGTHPGLGAARRAMAFLQHGASSPSSVRLFSLPRAASVGVMPPGTCRGSPQCREEEEGRPSSSQ